MNRSPHRGGAVLILGLLLAIGSTQVLAQQVLAQQVLAQQDLAQQDLVQQDLVQQDLAQAQDPKAAELCTPDVMRLCSEFVPDVDQITTCMQAKRRQLSPECLAVFKPKRRRHAPIN